VLALALAAVSAAAIAQSRWWLGFIDAEDRAFFEIPREARACAERDAAVRRAEAAPGAVVVAPRDAGALIGPGERLSFAVIDAQGVGSVRVLTRLVAITREEEGRRLALEPPCWYLAQAGEYGAHYRVTEDRLAVAVHPPRPLRLRAVDRGWRALDATHGAGDATPGALDAKPGALDAKPGALDGKPTPPGAEGFPTAWQRMLARALPGAALWHAQPFGAVRVAGGAADALLLLGAVAAPGAEVDAPGTYNTLNMIVADSADPAQALPLFQSGPSGGHARSPEASYVAQIAAVVDLDGDGVDELIVRARHFAGGTLRVLRWTGARYVEIRRGGYEGE
jgi:hypothetical protein